MGKSHMELLNELQEKALADTMVDAKRILRQKNGCEHAEHRIQPNRYDDWKAIDNMMVVVMSLLVDAMTDSSIARGRLSKLAHSGGSELSTEDQDLVSMFLTCETIVKACTGILLNHHTIVAIYGRANSADMHYERILNEMVDQCSTVGKEIHDHGLGPMIEKVQTDFDEVFAKKFKSNIKRNLH